MIRATLATLDIPPAYLLDAPILLLAPALVRLRLKAEAAGGAGQSTERG